jgi:hypothetical protein
VVVISAAVYGIEHPVGAFSSMGPLARHTNLRPPGAQPPYSPDGPRQIVGNPPGGASPSGSPAVPVSASQHLRGTSTLVLATGPAQRLIGVAALTDLNRQRELNGIPVIPTINQWFSRAWCPAEDTGPSGGETMRDWSAALDWDRSMTPWDDAPLHQISLYHPLMTTAGASDATGGACLGLGNPARSPVTPTFYAYTSDTGRNDVPPVEIVSGERPYAPQELIGIKEGVPTGPQLIVYAEGFPGEAWNTSGAAMQITSATLATGTGQPVRGMHVVDSRTAAGYADATLFSDAAVLIPPRLRPNSIYKAMVEWRSPKGQTARQTFEFATGTSPALGLTVHAELLSVRTRSPEPLYFSVARRGQSTSRQFILKRGASVPVHFPAGQMMQLCFYLPPGGGYTSGRLCGSLSYRESTTVSVKES